MHALANKHKTLWVDKVFTLSSILGLLFFIVSLCVNYAAVLYSAKAAGSATTDILLQNLPVVNTDIIFSEGALLFVIFVTVLLLVEPKIIPFTLKSIALFICIRATFVSMTHLGPSPDQIVTDFSRWGYTSSGADLFFSGHTGLPFLLALMYWDSKKFRYIFLFCSVVAAVAVILGHLHYTIDVFSAYFISYGIFHIARKFFAGDYHLFRYGLRTIKEIEVV